MALTHRLFGIRSCNETINGQRGRPCLEYDINRCLAPCVAAICGADAYARAVKDTELFLSGRNDELAKALEARMREAAERERFEEAAELRDAVRTVRALVDRQQKMATTELGHRDIFGLELGPRGVAVQVFLVRRGRVIERLELGSEAPLAGSNAGEVLQAALQQFYELRDAPPEIHVPSEPDEREALETWLGNRAGRRVRILVPQRGGKRGLVELANRNAALAYRGRFLERAAGDEALDLLQTALALGAAPRRIECFDVSTIQGRDTVAAMVVSEGGRMRRSDYRKFRIRGPAAASAAPGGAGRSSPGDTTPALVANNDFAAMHEVVLRRYRRLLELGGPFPDLVLIDGGKGQLSAAYAALAELGLANLVAVAMAKKEELLYTRDRPDPLALPAASPALRLLQRIRDEAHRFAVTFHRQARSMRDLRSDLDEVPGIGAGRRRALLTAFGSLSGVRRATREELAAVVGPNAADRVLAFFASRP